MRQLVIIGLLTAAAALPAAGLPPLEDTVLVRDWLLLGPFPAGVREGITGIVEDPATFSPDTGRDHYSGLVQGGTVRWRAARADSLGWLETGYDSVLWDSLMDFYGLAVLNAAGYAWAEIELPRACVGLAIADRCGLVVNGRAVPGNSYGDAWFRVPVRLDSGTNRILLSIGGFADRRVRFALVPPPAPLSAITGDITAPDPVVGRPLDAVFGIPVMNSSDVLLDSVRLAVALDSAVAETTLAGFGPFSVRKVPLHLRLPAPADTTPLAVVVTLCGAGFEQTDTFELRPRQPEDARRETFVSAIDGSCQYYGIRYPADYDPARRYPVIFSLHGAGVEARGQANSYRQKDWAFVVAPTNRRPYGFDWQDWGRLDAIEVLDTVLARLPIDPDRVLLTGGSMGGHGAWHVATCHPDRFAAVAPQASWPTHQLYVPWFMQKSAVLAQPGALAHRDAALRQDNVPALMTNLINVPAFILHGGLDDNVPALHGRNFAARLDELGYEFRYREVAGRKHWWTDDSLGTTVSDDTALIGWIRDRGRVAGPRRVRFRTADLGSANRAWWVTVEQVGIVGRDAEIEATATDSLITVTTLNVNRFSLELVEPLFFPTAVRLLVDGQDLGTLKSLPARVTLHRNRDRWRLGIPRSPRLAKTPSRHGPCRQAMFRPFLLVFGTGDPATARALYDEANAEALRWWNRANGLCEVVADTALTAEQARNRNLLLYGTERENRYLARIGRELPLRVIDGRLWLGRQDLGPDLAALFVYPNPESPDRLVLVRTGTDPEHARLASFWGVAHSGAGIPDFVVFDRTVRREGWAGVRAAGFFGTDWQLDPVSTWQAE